jgi:hypothetical protein
MLPNRGFFILIVLCVDYKLLYIDVFNTDVRDQQYSHHMFKYTVKLQGIALSL